jgi:mannose-6-phosphate isomerase-like protein (cupin superfamily)
MYSLVNIEEKFAQFSEHWHPYIIGELNGQYVKAVKAQGEMVWHHHDHEDELFLILRGTFIMDFRDRTVEVRPGEFLIVPKGVEHRPRTGPEEVHLLLFEPKETLHTGTEVFENVTVSEQAWI